MGSKQVAGRREHRAFSDEFKAAPMRSDSRKRDSATSVRLAFAT
jgi:hypothetical protein